MFGDGKKFNKFAYVKRNCSTEEYMVERDGVAYTEDGLDKKITLVFNLDNGILRTVETVHSCIKDIVCSDSYDEAESVSIQNIAMR